MDRTRAALALLLAGATGLALISGSEGVDPRTPPALPGQPPPFLATAVVGDGGVTGAVDSYGNLVGLWAPGPAGRALIDNPSDRQAAGSVDVRAGIVPRVRIGGGALPLWRAGATRQSYLPGTNVVRTVAELGPVRAEVTAAASGARLALTFAVGGAGASPSVNVTVDDEVRCRRDRHPGQLDLLCGVGPAVPGAGRADQEEERDGGGPAGAMIRRSAAADRRWLAAARPLGPGAPRWAIGMYERSLLVMRALTDTRSGAVAAGARDGWAYVWPRDAGAVALAFAAAGHRAEARRIARFLTGIDFVAAARFDGAGDPVPGRDAQGDAAGWVAAAAYAAGLSAPAAGLSWRGRADYHEGAPGDFLANAIAAWGVSDLRGAHAPLRSDTPLGGTAATRAAWRIAAEFGGARGLVRRQRDPESGLDSAAAWAVRPFALPALFPAARRTLRELAGRRGRYGITPGEGWGGGVDPWSASTAWTAWGLAGLAREARAAGTPDLARTDRRTALRLLAALRRAATPAGALPERVDVETGVPRSTTPLTWSHAFAALALLELWPPDLSSSRGGEDGDDR
jgi:hypothetical protein